MTAFHVTDADTVQHAADWLFNTPDAEDRLNSERVLTLIADMAADAREGLPLDVKGLADAIGGPRAVAEALATFIDWRFAPPPAGALQ